MSNDTALLQSVYTNTTSLQGIDTNATPNYFIREQILKFINIKTQNPKLKQEEICKLIGISKSTLHRNMNKLGINLNYNGKHMIKSTNT